MGVLRALGAGGLSTPRCSYAGNSSEKKIFCGQLSNRAIQNEDDRGIVNNSIYSLKRTLCGTLS
jgi:hypothetical protein